MKFKKMIFVTVIVGLINLASLAVAADNPILKADRKQLEEWRINETYLGGLTVLGPFYADYVMKSYDLSEILKTNLTVKDLLNPAVKMHVKKEFGLPITPEDKAMAEKKWTANPLLEVDDAQLQKWLTGSACKFAYTEPGEEKLFNGSHMDYCARSIIPRIMLDTGVEISPETFVIPEVFKKASRALKAQK